MNRFEHEAIVLKSARSGENDRILTALTLKAGKISIMAKGAQSAKCKYLLSCQPFAFSQFVLALYPKNPLMPYAISADLINPFRNLYSSVERQASACFATEAVDAVLEPEAVDSHVFMLLYHTLRLLCSMDASRASLMALAFTLKLLAICGHAPELGACLVCGAKLETYFINVDMGGILCARCAKGEGECIVSSLEAEYSYALMHMDMESLGEVYLVDEATQLKLLKVFCLFLPIQRQLRSLTSLLPE
ncbi:MAG: DNA repair protein RecO [Eubacteriaceae bacterium]|nr:DNA repair protein RecO [Eubacteriaceae bacterium]